MTLASIRVDPGVRVRSHALDTYPALHIYIFGAAESTKVSGLVHHHQQGRGARWLGKGCHTVTAKMTDTTKIYA